MSEFLRDRRTQQQKDFDELKYGKHSVSHVWARNDGKASIIGAHLLDHDALADRPYTPTHARTGNDHHWWPETGFTPPKHDHPYEDGDSWWRGCPHHNCGGAPFRMKERKHWEVASRKGFSPGQFVRVKYPDKDRFFASFHSVKYGDMYLLFRHDFARYVPGDEQTRKRAGSCEPWIAWRVKHIHTGNEFVIQEWRLESMFDPQQARYAEYPLIGEWSGT